MNSNVIYKDDQEYPELLKKAGKDAPKQIYFKKGKTHPSKGLYDSQNASGYRIAKCKKESISSPDKGRSGGVSSIFKNCLSVIGSRKLTSYGRQAGEQLVGQIAASGITIVSGFMYGGDALAHQSAVKSGGRTIAVMPCGIDLIHPEHQEELYKDIINNQGMIISEYEGDMKPALWTYPRRNRIVAGLSQALLVIEAGEKSGTLITVNYAKKFKRKIFALPGPITGSVSKGTNMLIKEGVAEMVTSVEDVLGWFKKTHPSKGLYDSQNASGYRIAKCKKELISSPDKGRSGGVSSKILEMLKREPLAIDELSRDLEISSAELGVKLSMMEMQGVIKLRSGKYYDK